MASRQDFAQAILQAGGWPVTDSNVKFLVAWMHREGGSAAFNPINTTRSAPGATNYNKVGVKNYTSMQQGVQAIVDTLGESFYGSIRSALASGDATTADKTGQLASALHAWSAGPNAPMSKGYTSVTSSGFFNNIANLAEQTVSAAASAVGGAARGAAQNVANQQAQFGDIDGFLQSQAPALAAAINDPKVHDLLSQWGAGQLSDQEFQQKLEATDWWKNTPQSQRTLLVSQATDPATARQNLANQMASVDSLAWQLGAKLTPDIEYRIALDSIKNQWSSQQVQSAIAAQNKTTYTSAGQYGGQAASDVQQIKNLYASYALPVDDHTLNNLVGNVLAGKSTVQDLEQQVAQQAATFYAANPALSEFLKSGQGSAQSWAAPLVSKVANILGVNPNSIDLTNSQWSFILKPQTNPQTGQSTGMAQTLDSVEQKIKTDPIYGYSTTANGIQDYQSLDDAIRAGFGAGKVA